MSDRRRLAARLAPGALVLLLGAALLVPPLAPLELQSPDEGRVRQMRAVIDDVPRDGIVVIGFDPDIGTYAEIRPTVRVLLAELLDRGARLALVSLTPEGRALALAELERLRGAGIADTALADLGFRPGAEAALVSLVADPVSGEPTGPGTVTLSTDGLQAAALLLVIGGIDLGPRSWVEQVRTRLPAVPIATVVPTVLLPELQPYLGSGQLEALIGTVRDGAAFRAAVAGDVPSGPAADRPATPLALLLGMLVAVGLLLQAAGARLVRGVRAGVFAGDGG